MTKFDESRYIVKARIVDEWKEDENPLNWVEGCLLIANNKKDYFKYKVQPVADSSRYAFPVDPETICKPTGQKDKNNALIFEHDLCKLNDEYVDEDEIFEVLWDEKNARYILKGEHSQYNFVTSCGPDFEVVGNVFDKQEVQKDAERTLFIGDKDKEEIAAWLKSNAKLGTAYATFEDGSKAEILIFQELQKADIYFPDGVRITGATLDEVSEELVKVSLTKKAEEEMEK